MVPVNTTAQRVAVLPPAPRACLLLLTTGAPRAEHRGAVEKGLRRPPFAAAAASVDRATHAISLGKQLPETDRPQVVALRRGAAGKVEARALQGALGAAALAGLSSSRCARTPPLKPLAKGSRSAGSTARPTPPTRLDGAVSGASRAERLPGLRPACAPPAPPANLAGANTATRTSRGNELGLNRVGRSRLCAEGTITSSTTPYTAISRAVPMSVVQGTPVGQADMTVPRSFTSGLCDCCDDGKTCLAVWCCSPITTCAQCLAVHLRAAGLVPRHLGHPLRPRRRRADPQRQIQNAILQTCATFAGDGRGSSYRADAVRGSRASRHAQQIASYTSAVLFAAVFFMTCQYAARLIAEPPPLRARRRSRAVCSPGFRVRVAVRAAARRRVRKRARRRLVLRRGGCRPGRATRGSARVHAPRRSCATETHEVIGQLQPVRARRAMVDARERRGAAATARKIVQCVVDQRVR